MGNANKPDIRDYLGGKPLDDESVREACITEDELRKVLRIRKGHVIRLRQRGALPVAFRYRGKFWFPRVEVHRFIEGETPERQAMVR